MLLTLLSRGGGGEDTLAGPRGLRGMGGLRGMLLLQFGNVGRFQCVGGGGAADGHFYATWTAS